MSSFWLRLADRMILVPTRHKIDAGERRRQLLSINSYDVEACLLNHDNGHETSHWCGLKFPGAGGRAERGGPHPMELLSPDRYEVWTINPPGYGGSSGKASIANIVSTARGAWERLVTDTHSPEGHVKRIVVGNSLGCLYALYVAAHFHVDGVFLRNPPPLEPLIIGRHSWWNFGLGARLICRHIPDDIDAISNAARSTAPLFLVTSELDTVVPPRFQQLIFDAYIGPKTQFLIHGVDHHVPVPESQWEEYELAVRQFGEQLAAS